MGGEDTLMHWVDCSTHTMGSIPERPADQPAGVGVQAVLSLLLGSLGPLILWKSLWMSSVLTERLNSDRDRGRG